MPAVKPRKKPTQKRSQQTVAAILDAAARVLVEDGYDKASTNRIAKVAGVSIGSLYQYFPNKEAIIIAVAQRHSDQQVDRLGRMAAELASAPIPDAVRAYVRAMLAAHALDPELQRVIVQQVMHLGLEHVQLMQDRAVGIVRAYLELHRDEILPENLDVAAFVLVTTVEAIVHTALLGGTVALQTPLEEELVQLILRYLGAQSATPAPSSRGR